MKKYTIYHNGKYRLVNLAFIDHYAPGHYDADGVFETLRIVNGVAVNIDAHLDRFFRGAGVYSLKVPCGRNKIKTLSQAVIDKNKIREGRLRFSAFKADTKHFLIVALNQKQPPETFYKKGAKVIVAEVKRNRSRTSHIKSQRWALFKGALDEAKAKGADEAILSNQKGHVVEGATTNLFFVKKNKLFTPAIACGCLNGVTRNKVMALARSSGLRVQTGIFSLKSLLQADEVFLTNAYKGIIPVVKVDTQRIGRGRPGPVTKMLRQNYIQSIQSEIAEKY